MFVKHIGKQSDRKVVVVFREVPGEEHMALVLYPETLQMNFHDAIMKVLESTGGQEAENLGDVMFRSLFPDGRPMLQTLHKEGMIKKVRADQIIVTPNAASHVRLDELNKVLNQMKQSTEAKAAMAALDANSGLGRDRLYEVAEAIATPPGVDVLTDEAIAQQRLEQATKMESDAQSLLVEAQRLRDEAAALLPPEVVVKKPARSRAKKAASA